MQRKLSHLKALRLSAGVQLSLIYLACYFWSCYKVGTVPSDLSIFLVSLLGIMQTSWCMLLDDAHTFDEDIQFFSGSGVKRYKPGLEGTHTKDDLYWMSIVGLIICFFILVALFNADLMLWSLVAVSLVGGLTYIRWNKKTVFVELLFSYPIGLIMFTISYAITSDFWFASLFLVWGWLAYVAVIAHADIAELPLKTDEKNLARHLGGSYCAGYRIIPVKLRVFIISCYTLALICSLYIPYLFGFRFLSLVALPILFVFLVCTLKTTNWSLPKLKLTRVLYNYLATFFTVFWLLLIYPIQMELTLVLLVSFLLIYNYICFKGPLHQN